MYFYKQSVSRRLLLAALAGCFGLCGAVHASDAGRGIPRADGPVKAQIADVMLHEGGILIGSFYDGQGKPVSETKVSVQQNGEVIATAVTNKKGQFGIRGLRGGVYEVATDRGNGLFRLWSGDGAPPSAHRAIVIVADSETVRGQDYEGNPLFDPYSTAYRAATLGLSAAGLTVGIIALVEANKGS